ncbi:MAG: hypothetical protein L3J74_11990 [Bacteroidales bacterium]|nr:hypothetical protein [Bacteroidales bacterium]
MKKIFLLFLSFILIYSCNKEEYIGMWDDIIKLSVKNVEFGANTDSVLIKTEGDWWWIYGISFEDSTYSYNHDEDINLESNNYIIIEDNFVVERRDKNTLFIKLDKNTSGKERIMTVGLEAGDYFDSVTIKQSAK